MNELTVLLPAYNEEKTIGLVIDEIRSYLPNVEIIVVDNNSTDDTKKVLVDKKANWILFEKKQGKGHAFKKGLEKVETPFAAMIDADYTYPALYLPLVFELLKYYDVVMGYRTWKQQGSMSKLNAFGNYLLSRLASILFMHRTWDLCTGMWGFKKSMLDKFNITSSGFALEADFFSNAKRLKCRIVQIPIDYRKRPDESTAKLKVWDGFKIAWFLIKRRFSK